MKFGKEKIMNKRNEVEAIVKDLDIRKTHNAFFNFGGYTWATPVVKKLLATFAEGEVEVTIGEKNLNPAMIFKWKQGDAFVYTADVIKNLKEAALKRGAIP
jgi:hypothetical protein